MLEWERILKQDRLLRAMTGLNRKGFEAILPSFSSAYRESLVDGSRAMELLLRCCLNSNITPTTLLSAIALISQQL